MRQILSDGFVNAASKLSSISQRKIATVRRSFMYVPSDHESKLKKIPSMSPDCAVVDLEDGVGMQSKDQARNNVRRILNGELPIDFGATEFALRINPVTTKEVYEMDMKSIFSVGNSRFPNMLVIPKVEDVDQVKFYYDELARQLKRHQAAFEKSRQTSKGPKSAFLELGFMVESPRAVINLREMLTHVRTRPEERYGLLRLSCLVFGADDYGSAMQIERADDDIKYSELAYARQKIATCARAFDLDAIDLVLIDFRNEARLAESSQHAARIGFSGKQIVHPSQIRPVNEAFAPSPTRVAWATKLLTAWKQHSAKGTGVFVFEGKMIDMPTVRIADNVVARHSLITQREHQKQAKAPSS